MKNFQPVLGDTVGVRPNHLSKLKCECLICCRYSWVKMWKYELFVKLIELRTLYKFVQVFFLTLKWCFTWKVFSWLFKQILGYTNVYTFHVQNTKIFNKRGFECKNQVLQICFGKILVKSSSQTNIKSQIFRP